jgi:hypothetical protein
MKSLFRLTLALAAGFAVLPVLAAPAVLAAGDPTHDAAVANVRAILSKAATSKHDAASHTKAMGTNVYPGTPLANEFRAYPPSCAAWPLPNKSSGGVVSTARLPLYTRNSSGQAVAPETVTVTLWRLACSSTGDHTPYNVDGGYNAMTFLRIDRDTGNEGHTDYFPTFPALQVKQGSIDYPDSESFVRSAQEPNTFTSDFLFDTPIYASTTFVLENYNFDEGYIHLYNNAFTLRVNPYANNVTPLEFPVADYVPTQSTYPDAFAPLPLDGYAAAQWINTTLNEGLLIQVTEQLQSNGSTVRQMIFDLLTEDQNGDPLWLVGNAAFAVGQTSIQMDLIYLGNGLSHNPWGHATVVVGDCNHLEVNFTANSNLPAPIPAFNGLTEYNRIFNANGMVCE